MIHIDVAAHMDCTEKDCGASLGIKLCLTLGGTFAARPPTGHGWQIGATQQGVLTCRCPQHHTKIELPQGQTIGDAILRTNGGKN